MVYILCSFTYSHFYNNHQMVYILCSFTYSHFYNNHLVVYIASNGCVVLPILIFTITTKWYTKALMVVQFCLRILVNLPFIVHFTNWIQISTDILSVLIWVQTLCKGYQQTAKVIGSKEELRV